MSPGLHVPLQESTTSVAALGPIRGLLDPGCRQLNQTIGLPSQKGSLDTLCWAGSCILTPTHRFLQLEINLSHGFPEAS